MYFVIRITKKGTWIAESRPIQVKEIALAWKDFICSLYPKDKIILVQEK